jgi:hypothetical protein
MNERLPQLDDHTSFNCILRRIVVYEWRLSTEVTIDHGSEFRPAYDY